MTVLSTQARLLDAGAPDPVQVVCAWKVRLVFPLGTVSATCEVQEQGEPVVGMLKTVVELVTVAHALRMSEVLQLAALTVCARAFTTEAQRHRATNATNLKSGILNLEWFIVRLSAFLPWSSPRLLSFLPDPLPPLSGGEMHQSVPAYRSEFGDTEVFNAG